ncbi:phospholipase C [Granulicella pectinivorans]|uniref:Phospholipase C n=2 Tax=Granulicella pectinivorans TaxID=474950 RepID=A0A1I6LE81_9BACT|nr:phospholipase C [Granulicella pectinivorans]
MNRMAFGLAGAIGVGLALTGAARAQVEIAPPSSKETMKMAGPVSETLSHDAKLKLLRQKVKYVFVLFQENRSFDFYFGTYPGADGLYPKSGKVPGFVQPIVNVDGTVGTISPFRIPSSIVDKTGKTVQLYPMDLASVNHAHVPSVKKLHLDAENVAANDRYSVTEEGLELDANGKPNKFPTLARKQMGEVVMGHIDCDMAPFMWRWADRFTLFDHFMDTEIGPSTPNAIAMISGQVGETQWMLHPEEKGVPMLADPYPYWGSKLDPTKEGKQPQVKASSNPSPNLTYATLPLSFMGDAIEKTTAKDRDKAFDLLDVKEDIAKIAGHGVAAVPWGWYQEGYDHEPSDLGAEAKHAGYVVHHNAPQYFGYISNNPDVNAHMHGLGDFFADMKAEALPKGGGAFYVRGGQGNLHGYKPLDPTVSVQDKYSGDDDHPGYSDSQISEALLAEEINAIAASPYWKDSVILIAYDETDGLYDHVRPIIRSADRVGLALHQGPRIPSLLISPYGVAHGVSHEPVEHSSIIKLVDELFGLIPLADLPDEMKGRKIGEAQGLKNMGPADDLVAGVGDMLSGFDDARLTGKKKPLPGSYAMIPAEELPKFPHFGGEGCKALGITPTDWGRPNPLPADFNPRPVDSPGIPADGGWKP